MYPPQFFVLLTGVSCTHCPLPTSAAQAVRSDCCCHTTWTASDPHQSCIAVSHSLADHPTATTSSAPLSCRCCTHTPDIGSASVPCVLNGHIANLKDLHLQYIQQCKKAAILRHDQPFWKDYFLCVVLIKDSNSGVLQMQDGFNMDSL